MPPIPPIPPIPPMPAIAANGFAAGVPDAAAAAGAGAGVDAEPSPAPAPVPVAPAAAGGVPPIMEASSAGLNMEPKGLAPAAGIPAAAGAGAGVAHGFGSGFVLRVVDGGAAAADALVPGVDDPAAALAMPSSRGACTRSYMRRRWLKPPGMDSMLRSAWRWDQHNARCRKHGEVGS